MESTGSGRRERERGREGVGNGYIYIYTECWVPLDRSSKDVETNRGDSERESERWGRGRGKKDERGRECEKAGRARGEK